MMKSILKILKRVIAIILLVLPIILILYSLIARIEGKTPTLFGYSVQIVLTGSMEDVLPVGSLILSHSYDGELLEENTIITYIGSSGEMKGKPVTHQIVEVLQDDNGNPIYRTKGTANTQADPDLVDPSMISSVFVLKIVNLGWLYNTVMTKSGFLLIVVIPILLLIIYECFVFAKTIRKEKESNEKSNGDNS